jgi:hypothetical protein
MLATISNGGIERLDDLHVDEIDENWKQRTNWIPASIRANGRATGGIYLPRRNFA